MNEKTILILIDGMASYAVDSCNHPFKEELLNGSIFNLYSTTVMPSITLPCHMSLFCSVPPQRHGILTNTYVPQVRPIEGLAEQLAKYNKINASFYNWDELRDITRPGSIAHSCFISEYLYQQTDFHLTENVIQYMRSDSPDFVFLYLGETDETGHKYGWGSAEYNKFVYDAWTCIQKIYRSSGNEYNFIITADHGGHDQTHGTDIPMDMQIPIIIKTVSPHCASSKIASANITDIAPTITSLMRVEANKDWRGISLLEK